MQSLTFEIPHFFAKWWGKLGHHQKLDDLWAQLVVINGRTRRKRAYAGQEERFRWVKLPTVRQTMHRAHKKISENTEI